MSSKAYSVIHNQMKFSSDVAGFIFLYDIVQSAFGTHIFVLPTNLRAMLNFIKFSD